MPKRKYTADQVSEVVTARMAGEKWSVLEMLYGGVCRNARDTLRATQPPPPSHSIKCQCGHINHVRTHFCRGCGYITEAGKRA